MKKILFALLVLGAFPVAVSAYCPTCKAGSRSNRYMKNHYQYSKTYNYDSREHQNSIDYSVTEEDQRIARELRARIQNGNFQNPNDIQIFVEYGKVILEGKVSSSSAKNAAEQAAFQVTGVRNVVNGLYVDNRDSHQNGSQVGQQQRNSFFN